MIIVMIVLMVLFSQYNKRQFKESLSTKCALIYLVQVINMIDKYQHYTDSKFSFKKKKSFYCLTRRFINESWLFVYLWYIYMLVFCFVQYLPSITAFLKSINKFFKNLLNYKTKEKRKEKKESCLFPIFLH